MIDLSSLNAEQREAVLDREHNLLLLACAGSGKTRTITSKIAYYLESGILRPYQVLAVTFTNKAAHEMRERIGAMLPDADLSALQMRTFHSFGAYVLRADGALVGLGDNFSIYDDDDSLSLLANTFPTVDKKILKGYQKCISKAKDMGIDPDDGRLNHVSADPGFRMAYKGYEAALRRTGNCDFADLVSLAVRLFDEHAEVAEKYRRRFRLVLVDEYQDSNSMQFEFLKRIVGPDTQLCVVGDDDQSIYSFRGADISNILTFTSSFGNVREIKLEKNYRSTSEILAVASSVIDKNVSRHKKEIVSATGIHGSKPELLYSSGDRDEAERIAAMIKLGRNYSGTAVIYRTNAQSLAFEQAFTKERIPHHLVGALRFYDREEIKDALAFLFLLANPRDIVNFRRIINKPARGIGPKALDDMLSFSDDVVLCLEEYSRNSKTKAAQGASNFLSIYKTLKEDIKSDDMDLGGILFKAMASLGLLDMYKEEKDPAIRRTRLENLDTLRGSLAEKGTGDLEHKLYDYLESITLDSTTLGGTGEEEGEGVTLITMHNTKGLEFDRVFVVGLEDELIPGQGVEDGNLEEERRIFYVAITRARKYLYLSYALSRFQWGRSQIETPSRFLKDIPKELYNGSLVDRGGFSLYGSVGSRLARPYASAQSGSIENRPKWAAKVEVIRKHEKDRPKDFEVGGRVRSPMYGQGTVVSVEGDPGRRMINVDFDRKGRVRLNEAYASLEPVSKRDGASYAVGDRVRSPSYGDGIVSDIAEINGNRVLTVDFSGSVVKLVADYAKLEKLEG